MRFGDPWTEEQQALADVVIEVWAVGGTWPTYAYVADTLSDHGLDAATILTSFPFLGHRSPISRYYADVTFDHTYPRPQEDSKVGLSVSGLYRHPLGTQSAQAYIAVLRYLAERRRDAPRKPTGLTSARVTGDEVEHALFRYPPQLLRPMFGLLQQEPISGRGSSSSSPEEGTWSLDVGREMTRYLDLTMEKYLAMVEEDLDGDRQRVEALYGSVVAVNPVEDPVSPATPSVFLVHGHDGEAKDHVARTIWKLTGQEPIILDEQASEGRTVIEKFEAYGEGAGYAVVLLTADDRGGPEGGAVQPRARQNVVFELGYFVGRLGRRNVVALTKGQPELPSDFAGIVYISLDSADWTTRLSREMRAAGIDSDLNSL